MVQAEKKINPDLPIDIEQPSILIVDDKPGNLLALENLLEGFDAHIFKALSGFEALELMLEREFALVLLDVQMPRMDGFETAELMRGVEKTKYTPIIFVTAINKDQKYIFEGYEHGAVDYLFKPLDPCIIKGKVSVFLDLYRQKQLYKTASMEMEQLAKQRARQLVHADRLASIGQLAAGVAHEINNPVGFINSNLGSLASYIEMLVELFKKYDEVLLSMKALGNDKMTQIAEEIERMKSDYQLDYVIEDFMNIVTESLEGTERIKKIVSALKNFSRADSGEGNKPTDLNDGLRNTLNVVWNELKYKCIVETHYGDLPLVNCDPCALNQVFMNLLVNAAQAIEEQGSVTISTRHVRQAREGMLEYVEIIIADTGSGIPEENLDRIFDAFFTTKEVGKGTGLGLSISYDIIKKHHGEIAVKSEKGVGTEFTIRLPVADD
ncbi:MAG: ATP-binding protein [Planctomycetota bacterium]